MRQDPALGVDEGTAISIAPALCHMTMQRAEQMFATGYTTHMRVPFAVSPLSKRLATKHPTTATPTRSPMSFRTPIPDLWSPDGSRWLRCFSIDARTALKIGSRMRHDPC